MTRKKLSPSARRRKERRAERRWDMAAKVAETVAFTLCGVAAIVIFAGIGYVTAIS